MSMAVERPARTEPKFRKHWLERRRATIALGILAPLVIVTLLTPPLLTPGSWLALAVDLCGWSLFLAGAVLRWWATLYIGGRKGNEIVQSGPYAVTRNPLYLGSLFIALSLVCFLQSVVLLAGMLPAAWLYLGFTLPSEARRLEEKHGSAYRDYCRRVPSLWPKWRRWQNEPTLEVDCHCLYLEALRSLRWLSVPVLAELAQHLRSLPNWPHALLF